MHAFRDASGRSWELTLTVAMLRRVKDLLGVDLAGLFADDMKGYAALLADPVLRANVLWVMIAAQGEKAGITDEQFGASLDGEAMEAGTKALTEECVDFFPSSKRQPLRQILARTEELGAELVNRLMAKSTDQEVEQILETLDAKSKSSSGNAPGFSESIPARSL